MTTTIYIAGPMTVRKDSDWNYPAFHAEAYRLRGLGYKVKNPAEHFDGDTTLSRKVYIRKALQTILDDADPVHVVALLPGWEDSDGALREVYAAQGADIPVVLAADIRAVNDGFPHLPSCFLLQDCHIGGPVPQSIALLPLRPIPPANVTVDDVVRPWDGDTAVVREVLPPAPPESILDEANRIVSGARRRDYGHPRTNFRRIAEMWSPALEPVVKTAARDFREWVEAEHGIESEEYAGADDMVERFLAYIDQEGIYPPSNRTVGHLMMALKIARDTETPKRDNLVDAAGYANATDLATQDEVA